jgi:hypothetical protein
MQSPNDEPKQESANRPASEPRSSALSRGMRFKLAALGLTLVSALGATGLAKWLKNPSPELKPAEGEMRLPARLFQNWGKPDFVIVLSAQQHGYLLPCGCSEPQVGGVERRYNFMQLLKKEKGWPVVAVDLGDVPQNRGPANLPNVQGLIKYRYSMKALKEMGYLAAGLGEYEGALSLGRVEGEWALNEPKPAVVVSNLKEPQNFVGFKDQEVQTVPGVDVKIGITSAVGPTVEKKIHDSSVKFTGTKDAVSAQLAKMRKAQVDLPILLYHGLPGGNREAVLCAEAFPEFRAIVCLSEEDEPPAQPISVQHKKNGSTSYLIQLGHKGKHVGVLGVYRNNQPGQPLFTFKYELVEMGIEYVTPKNLEADHPIIKMMEEYTVELKKENYLGKYGQSKHVLQAMEPVKNLKNPENGVPTYVGSQACAKCHDSAYDVWKASDHSRAYKTLVEAKRPSLRQFDAECIVCHVVGFGYQGGFTDETKTPKLKNVGCESCHGPGSLHVKNPKDPEWQARMNQPWRGAKDKGEKAKSLAIEKFCVKCHDIDNDVTWIHDPLKKKDPFKDKWSKIIHHKD